MGYVVLTTYLWPSNYSADHKRLERIPSNSSNYRRQSSRRWTSMHSELTPFSVQLELLPWYSEPQYYRRCVQKAGHVIAVLISTRGSQSAAQFLLLLTWQSFTQPIQLTQYDLPTNHPHTVICIALELCTLSLSLTKDAATTLAGMIM